MWIFYFAENLIQLKKEIVSSSGRNKHLVWVSDKLGSLSHLTCQERELVPLGADEVQIDVKAIGVNFADALAVQGLYPAAAKSKFVEFL